MSGSERIRRVCAPYLVDADVRTDRLDQSVPMTDRA